MAQIDLAPIGEQKRSPNKPTTTEPQTEFSFTDQDFDYIRQFLYQETGISLSPIKRQMVYGRVVKRLRYCGCQSVAAYLRKMRQSEDEKEKLINALTTNKTHFFREQHHFDFIKQHLLAKWAQQPKTRIWSAGCSTGEEPYSLACLIHLFSVYLRSKGSSASFQDARILATDLDTNVLERAKRGVYCESALDSIPESYLKSCFRKGRGENLGHIQVKPEVAQQVVFNQLNLQRPWPIQAELDLIMCRNVMIYFDKQTQKSLIQRFYDQLKPGGYLIIGHSEGLGELSHLFEHKGMTIFRKRED